MGNKDSGTHHKQAATTREPFPEIAVNLSVAALIWLFGVLVFIPMAVRIDSAGLPVLISLIILSSFSFFFLKGFKGLGSVLGSVSTVLAYEWTRRRKGKKEKNLTERTKRRFKVALHVATIIIVYLVYSPLLAMMHPSINGIAIILSILGIIFTILKKDN